MGGIDQNSDKNNLTELTSEVILLWHLSSYIIKLSLKVMPESKLVSLLDVIWTNKKRNETDFDQILTRELLTHRNFNHKLDGFFGYPNLFVVSKGLSCDQN